MDPPVSNEHVMHDDITSPKLQQAKPMIPLGCVAMDFFLLPKTKASMAATGSVSPDAANEIRQVVATQRTPPGGDATGTKPERQRAADQELAGRAAGTWPADPPLDIWLEDILHAVVCGHVQLTRDVLERWFESGANRELADAADARNWQERPLLNLACACGHLEVVRALLDAGANADSADRSGFTPLHESCHEGYAVLVELLLARGADPRGGRLWHTAPMTRPELAMSPLGIACKRGAHTCAAALLRCDPTLACDLDREGVPPFYTDALNVQVRDPAPPIPPR